MSINGFGLKYKIIKYGVPQGSVLWPLLFLSLMSYTKKIYNFLNKDANLSQNGLNATRISERHKNQRCASGTQRYHT